MISSLSKQFSISTLHSQMCENVYFCCCWATAAAAFAAGYY